MNIRSVAALTVALLAGCASHTEVFPLGSGRYMVGYQEKSKFNSWTEIKAITVQLADDYCAKQSQAVEVVDIQTHGVRGFSPQGAEVTFKCVPKPPPGQ